MKIVGMYIHQHWPYNYPYAARTWDLEDWGGYLNGLSKIGYNTVQIWPMLEIMPKPLTTSDREHLLKMVKVIDMAHELKMRVFAVLSPNIIANNEKAKQSCFQERHFFNCAVNINPAVKDDVSNMISWRKQLLRFLREVDGVTIIDSDPGGYPDSNNAEYVNILLEHRKMLDSLRPGIELVVWLHVGWGKFCQFYKTGIIDWETKCHRDFQDVLLRIKRANPEPWGIANGFSSACELGIESRVISFNYGAIEPEPSFPLTSFDRTRAYNAGAKHTIRGVMGNAQTHCIQLPNTFAFAQGALGKNLNKNDYLDFAEKLIPAYHNSILEGWEALGQSDPDVMYAASDKLNSIIEQTIQCGPLSGLLFNNPHRFLTDLVIQLRYKAAHEAFCQACENGDSKREPMGNFIQMLEIWQKRHGYKNDWAWYEARGRRFLDVLKALKSKYIEKVMSPQCDSKIPFEQVKYKYMVNETFTPRFINAMKQTHETLKS